MCAMNFTRLKAGRLQVCISSEAPVGGVALTAPSGTARSHAPAQDPLLPSIISEKGQ